MRKMRIVCKDCGYDEKREFYDREDGDSRNLRIVPPRCKKCGSTNVKLYD